MSTSATFSVAAAPAKLKQHETHAAKVAQVRPNTNDAPIAASKVAAKPANQTILAQTKPSNAKPFTLECWSEILSQLKQTNPPVLSILKKAEPRLNGAVLEIAFAFKLHQKKLEDGKFRTKFTECITSLGYECPEIVAVFDKNAAAPNITVVDSSAQPPDKDTTSVLAMMGGGEVVNA